MKIFLVFLSAALLQEVVMSHTELKYKEVIQMLKKNSQPEVIPIEKRDNHPLTIDVKISVLAVKEPSYGQFEVIIRQNTTFKNRALAYESSHSGRDVSRVSLPANYSWLPDLEYRDILQEVQILSPQKICVSPDGTVRDKRTLLLKFQANPANLSREGINITISIQSHTYPTTDAKFQENTEHSLDLSSFMSPNFRVSNPRVFKEEVRRHNEPKKIERINYLFELRDDFLHKDE